MSEENVEIVRRGYEAANKWIRGERDELEAWLGEFAAPEFEYVPTGDVPGVRGPYRGPKGLMEFLSSFWNEFDDARFEFHDLVETPEGVLAVVTFTGKGKQSGAEVDMHTFQVWTFRAGKTTRGQAFWTRAEALEAARLQE